MGESVQKPLLYYENNLVSTINLLKLMDKYGCHSLVFSSSATVYGSANVPITEETPAGTGITNAYGLIGIFLTLTEEGQTMQQHCDAFMNYRE